jgi:hypothetical protein
MRILPFTELASGAAGILRNELPHAQIRGAAAGMTADAGAVAMDLPGRLREHARAMYTRGGGEVDPPASEPADGDSAAAPAIWEPWTEPSGEPLGSSDGGSPAEGSWEPWTTPGATSTAPGADSTAQAESRVNGTPYSPPAPWNGGPAVRLGPGLLSAEPQSPSDAAARAPQAPSTEPPGAAA